MKAMNGLGHCIRPNVDGDYNRIYYLVSYYQLL
jgi:hypothetical protein